MLLSKQSSEVGASAVALSSFEGTRKCELNNGGVAQLGEQICEMVIEDLHRNAAGGVMGGAIFTLADYAFAICANALNEFYVTVTVSSTINFIDVCKGSKLVAIPECVKTGKNLCFYEIKIFDDLGNLVSDVLMTGMKKKIK